MGTTHIIGAGLAGLSAATRLASEGRRVRVYEAAAQAGGRCRSYHDAAFGATIDNGNHLLLSGNTSALSYLKRIGSSISGERGEPVFHFADARTGKRWALRLSKGRIPFWLFDKRRRVPDTKAIDYFSILRLLNATLEQTVTALIKKDTLYHRLWHPVLLSALNTELESASARLAGAVLRETLLKGGSACIPLVAEGLSATFIDPALSYLAKHGAQVAFNCRVRRIAFENERAIKLELASGEPVALNASDSVICAVPSWIAPELLPGVEVPDSYCAILNAHFRIDAPADFPAVMGVGGATTEWIFAFPGRISITVSAADRLMQEERETLAVRLWQEVAAITGLANILPPWQIVKEKRATFAATPGQDAKRPKPRTKWRNVHLAGDYVQTGLPATMEGAIRSGASAAELIMKRL